MTNGGADQAMRILLLAGGGGTRLWPLSNEARPKQFLPLLSERSLLYETYARLLPLSSEIFVATTARYADLVRSELKDVPQERIFAEPARRNSGPALLAAALKFLEDGDRVTAVVPSDQTVADAQAFRQALSAAGSVADEASVVVLAVAPARPETDFGYLELSSAKPGEAPEVLRFIEKPRPAEAAGFLAKGYFWNAGIFVFRPSRFIAEARRVAADLTASLERFRESLASGKHEEAADVYRALPSISIDYAVMERATGVKAVLLSAGWSDVGTWRAVRELRGASDDCGNLVFSEVPVLAPGVSDSAIVATREGVLVLPFEREGELRAAVEALRQESPGRAAGSPQRPRSRPPGRKNRLN